MTDLNQLTMFRQKDVEKLFAGCVFTNPVAGVQQCGWLSPGTILNDQVRQFWTMVKGNINPGMNPEEALEYVVKASIEAGITGELVQWSGDITYSHLPLPYANEIARRAYMTGVSSKFGDLVKAIQGQDDEKIRGVVRDMYALEVGSSIKVPDAYDIAARFADVVNGGMRSVPFFVGPLDNATGGNERQTLTIIAARPSVGKTALGWQIAQSAAYAGKRAVFFSLEMSSVNLWGRAACPKVDTTWRDVRAGRISDEKKGRLIEESYALSLQFEDRLKVIDTPQTTESIWRTVSEYRPDIFVVDHLRLVRDTHPSEVKRLGFISQQIKEIGKSFNTASILLAQLNRGVENRAEGNKRPVLADLRDSGEIEENGDLILMLHREDLQSQTERKAEKSITEVWIRKFRDGPRDNLIKLMFNPRDEWFEELPK